MNEYPNHPGGRHFNEMPKLKGNQNVRNTETGRFAPETERDLPERVVETDGTKEREPGAYALACWSIEELYQTQSEEELDRAFANLIVAVTTLRGEHLRELTEERLMYPPCTPE